MTSESKNIFGLDVGFGNFKLFGANASIILPSHVSVQTGNEYQIAGMSSGRKPLNIIKDGTSYYVGENAHQWGTPIENVDSNRLLGSPEASILMHGVFTHYMKNNDLHNLDNITVAVGLPLELSKANEARSNAAKVRSWIQGTHQWGADGEQYQITIDTVLITSQAAGVIQDHALGLNGQPIGANKPAVLGEVGLISIGYRTIEIMVLNNMKMNQNLTAGTSGGVRELLEICNGDQLYTLGELDSQLRSGKVATPNQQKIWERQAIGHIEKVWGKKWRRFEKVIIVGGGAEIASKTIANYFGSKLHKPDEPVLAIAKGMYKWAIAKSGG